MIYNLLRPLLFSLDPEFVHLCSLQLLSQPFFSYLSKALLSPLMEVKGLEKELWGIHFSNPIGLAAGFDKNGIGLQAWESLGFGFVEIGTVTPLPQKGNPKPRLARLPESEALWNSLGFPSEGAEKVSNRLKKFLMTKGKPRMAIGINIGKNRFTPLDEAVEDYKKCFPYFKDLADFFVVNVSSPNTVGLRSLQEKKRLELILDELNSINIIPKSPILVKISPDIERRTIAEIVGVLIEKEAGGVVVANTMLAKGPWGHMGGISGRPLSKISTELIRFVKKESLGRLPVIGVGGIFNTADAVEKIEAGTDLLEVFTGFVYNGPSFPKRLCQGLAEYYQAKRSS